MTWRTIISYFEILNGNVISIVNYAKVSEWNLVGWLIDEVVYMTYEDEICEKSSKKSTEKVKSEDKLIW